ncbi:hemolysin family protein [Prochlorococcus sp. MIT 1300]|uniref:hemolysin family protein n=1 Tax=Prochlorococcus sp. MIT 1300 TaxID=3096218 RepID=UPI002A7589B5|nr:hemolysin family protein [Prochlorococcus sp. MIT 1300]
MSSDLLLLVLLVVAVIAGSAFCSGVEAALLTVNPVRIHELAARTKPVANAKRLAKLQRRLGRTLSVLVVANNCFNIFGSMMLGGYAAWVFKQRAISGAALPLFSFGLTVLVILLGEILPKSLGSRKALEVSLTCAPVLDLLSLIMRPLVSLLEKLLPTITAETEISSDEEDIRQMAKIGSQQGQIEADEAAMITKVFQLNDLTARDLMTPRVAAPTLNGYATLESLRQKLLTKNSQWWVVLGAEVDNVLGIASRERLLTALLQGRGHLTPAELSEPVEFVPEMIRADTLLTGFQGNRRSMRVVVDEFGGFVGLIGAEAVLAVLAGWWRKSTQ